MVLKAKETGCDCIKFQTYNAEYFCADKNKKFIYKSQGKTVQTSEFEMFKKLEFTEIEWIDLFNFCKKKNFLFLTTVQDKQNLKLMLNLGLKAIKIGSDDFNYKENLKVYASTRLPLILSRGMATLEEIREIINFIRPLNKKISIMHCVSEYPVEKKNLNLLQIITLKKIFPQIVWGFSDHSKGISASLVAVALGAKIIEKHFTLNRNLPGPDHWFSLDIKEMKELVKRIRETEVILGNKNITISNKEKIIKKKVRRKIVAKHNLFSGDLLNHKNITFKRADNGIPLEFWKKIKGKKINKAKKINQVIRLKDIYQNDC